MIRPLVSPEAASEACASLIDLLPDWFGIPSSNAAYVAGVAECTCLGAFDPSCACIGLVALRPHFGTTLEIWWMGVAPGRHRQGIGARLMAAAKDEAIRLGCDTMVLMTLGEESDDPGYAATRLFYQAQGFRPLVHDHMGDPECPLIWMIHQVDQAAKPRLLHTRATR
ncbi:MAG: GNAT family N-acetyltransferase [Tabrizicola sp.]|nr:GNAT family N-acetyltransferase [Tabrizicola sp.]